MGRIATEYSIPISLQPSPVQSVQYTRFNENGKTVKSPVFTVFIPTFSTASTRANVKKNRAARELGRPSCSSRIMVDLARLAQLKRLLNDGTLTREEFEALKQKEL